jgi:hypothetical protein
MKVVGESVTKTVERRNKIRDQFGELKIRHDSSGFRYQIVAAVSERLDEGSLRRRTGHGAKPLNLPDLLLKCAFAHGRTGGALTTDAHR